MNGIVNLYKPPGITSAKAVYKVKQAVKTKVGHAGTLDPEAAGVLPILVGRATKFTDYIFGNTKTYVVEIMFGAKTTTQDATGEIILKNDNIPSAEEIIAVLPKFTGQIQQVPPMYSALKRDGLKLYELARKGLQIEREARNIFIDSINIIGKTSEKSYILRVVCGKGTYIRTLCEDIGTALNSAAYMNVLIRESVGEFYISDSVSIEEFSVNPLAYLKEPDLYLKEFKPIYAPTKLKKLLENGAKINKEQFLPKLSLEEESVYRIYCDDLFMGLGKYKNNILRPQLVYTAQILDTD
ncbi:MAG: tRNA pseudouridine(55) synthase TruB [Eubacteriales bacterium]|nr:tRNA pseudouridine(55) synthase TruB [Eubacteriales bacterium]